MFASVSKNRCFNLQGRQRWISVKTSFLNTTYLIVEQITEINRKHIVTVNLTIMEQTMLLVLQSHLCNRFTSEPENNSETVYLLDMYCHSMVDFPAYKWTKNQRWERQRSFYHHAIIWKPFTDYSYETLIFEIKSNFKF